MSYFMLSISLPDDWGMDFVSKVPTQKNQLDDLMRKGSINSFHLSTDRTKMWILMEADNEVEVMKLLADFVLLDDMEIEINQIAFSQNVNLMMHRYSLN